MRGHPDEIDEALAALGGRVAEELSADGWTRRLLAEDGVATLTRSTQNGVTAVVAIDRTSLQWPDDWPVEVGVALGVGYEPALNLMPLLTLRPRAVLIDDPEHGRENGFTVSLNGLDTVAHAVQQVVHFVNENASATTTDFPDPEAIEAYIGREIDSVPTESDEDDDKDDDDKDDDAGVSDFDTKLRLVVLAAMGRHDEARALLASYPADHSEAIDRADRRFIRQLTRWLDAGGPVAPPVEDTLAQLPRRARPPRPSWSDARAHSKAKKEALDAARERSKGKSLGELKEVIAAEFGARGIEIAPSVIDFNAEMLQVEQRPFGRARTAVKALRMLKSGGGEIVRLFRHVDGVPEWLEPPERASYPMIADRHRYTSVELDAGARDWLDRARTDAPRRIGPWVLIDVWFSREAAAGPLVVHIGERGVGTVSPSDEAEFAQVMRAAEMFDEDPFVEGRLTSADGAGAVGVEFPLPERHAGNLTT